MSFLTSDELSGIGLRSYGRKVLIDRAARLISPNRIALGDNVRIDCFSLISAGEEGVEIGSHVHISSGVYVYGTGGRVEIADFCGLSPGAKVFTASDDFTEGYLRGPQVPACYRRITTGSVSMAENSQVGAGAIILPGVKVGRNASVGALSLVSRSVPANTVVAGVPAREMATRDGALADRLVAEFLSEWSLDE